MQIAIINWSRRKAGGVEIYLEQIIAELSSRGHQLTFVYETDEPASAAEIDLPANVEAFSYHEIGTAQALARLQRWQPDLIYSHGLRDLALEAATIKIAPSVFFAHAYGSTCISGNKSYKLPVVTPCHRRFGWQCLLHYYPHHCGGLNPLTMFREYHKQSERLQFLKNYREIITFSDYMRNEYLQHDLSATRVYNFPVETGAAPTNSTPDKRISPSAPAAKSPPRAEWRLLFLGRMDRLKGGNIFLDALPEIKSALNCRLHVTFAGDGLSRRQWQAQAARLTSRFDDIKIDFLGWVSGVQHQELLNQSDLLVVPSLWPEPFGLVGLEAAEHQLPIAAFAVGGIPEWLEDGLNGYLAPGNPPTSQGLAQAVIKCLADADQYARLKKGTAVMAKKYQIENHLTALLEIFEKVVKINH